jgi:DNA-binding XRE family transcriptional regulator
MKQEMKSSSWPLATGARFIDSEDQMTIQTIKTASGEELVVLSRREYDALLAQLGDEDAEDRMTLLIAAEARGEAPLPASVSQAVLAGEGLLKSLRQWRGLTQAEVSKAAGLAQGFLSELEAGTKSGSAETVGKLALALDVPAGWIG